jgi:hypothetical protein
MGRSAPVGNLYNTLQQIIKNNFMLESIKQELPEETFLVADGFDECVIGYDYAFVDKPRLIYSVKAIIAKLVGEGMEEIDAIEYFEFNMMGGYVGEQTPIWCFDNF